MARWHFGSASRCDATRLGVKTVFMLIIFGDDADMAEVTEKIIVEVYSLAQLELVLADDQYEIPLDLKDPLVTMVAPDLPAENTERQLTVLSGPAVQYYASGIALLVDAQTQEVGRSDSDEEEDAEESAPAVTSAVRGIA